MIMLAIAAVTAAAGAVLFRASVFHAEHIQEQPASLAIVAYAILIVSSVTLVLGLWYLLLRPGGASGTDGGCGGRARGERGGDGVSAVWEEGGRRGSVLPALRGGTHAAWMTVAIRPRGLGRWTATLARYTLDP